MEKKYRFGIIAGLITLALINLFYNKGIFAFLPFYGQILLYFLLGLNKDFFKDKIFIFVISVLFFLLINSSPKNDFLLELYFTYKFPFYLVGFCLGFVFSRFDYYSRLSLVVGTSPLLLQFILVIFFQFKPDAVLYFLYFTIPLFFFYLIKNSKIKILIFFLIPTFLYLGFGLFAFDKPSLKVLLISFSLILIVMLEYFLLSKFKLNKKEI